MQYSLWCVLCADALSAVVVAKRHLVWDSRSILDIFTCQTTLASLSWWHGSCHFLLLLMLLTYLIAWKYLLTYQTMEVVTLTYRVAYLLDSMEVFTYLSNHSGKLVLIAWKLSSFSFVRSKLNLQPLGKMIRSWWKGFRVAQIKICRLRIGAPQKRCQEKVFCTGLFEMRTLADPGLYGEQRGSQDGCKYVHMTIIFFWKHVLYYHVFHHSTLITDMYPLSTLNVAILITFILHSSSMRGPPR